MNTGEILVKNGLNIARMISFSKSLYRSQYPDHVVIFNANIFTEEEGKVWYGDLDISIDRTILEKCAKESGKQLYVLHEMDGRFENEISSFEDFKKKAAVIVK